LDCELTDRSRRFVVRRYHDDRKLAEPSGTDVLPTPEREAFTGTRSVHRNAKRSPEREAFTVTLYLSRKRWFSDIAARARQAP